MCHRNVTAVIYMSYIGIPIVREMQEISKISRISPNLQFLQLTTSPHLLRKDTALRHTPHSHNRRY